MPAKRNSRRGSPYTKRTASGKPTAGKPGAVKFGSEEFNDHLRRNERERRRRGKKANTRGSASYTGTNKTLRKKTGSVTGIKQDSKAKGRRY